MAISLNNHESRIKDLENKTASGNLTVTKVSFSRSGDVFKISQPITNFSFIQVHTWNTNDSGNRCINLWCVKSLVLNTVYIAGTPTGGDANDHCILKFTDWSTIQMLYQAWYDGIKEIWGLKLYYNFSYNIYRLTQRLFDSSLLGLFSQKGGARTT